MVYNHSCLNGNAVVHRPFNSGLQPPTLNDCVRNHHTSNYITIKSQESSALVAPKVISRVSYIEWSTKGKHTPTYCLKWRKLYPPPWYDGTKGVFYTAYLITLFKIGKTPRVSNEIDGLTGIASEYQITIARRINKLCHFFPCWFVFICGFCTAISQSIRIPQNLHKMSTKLLPISRNSNPSRNHSRPIKITRNLNTANIIMRKRIETTTLQSTKP